MALKKITVALFDIRGATATGDNNPIVRACRRELKKPPEVYMATWTGRLQVASLLYNLPPEADAADRTFAQTGKLEPFEFLLDNTVSGGQPAPVAP